jgi:hypothetical protein
MEITYGNNIQLSSDLGSEQFQTRLYLGYKSWLSCDSSGLKSDPVYTWGKHPG